MKSISYRLQKKPYFVTTLGAVQVPTSAENDLWNRTFSPALAEKIKEAVLHPNDALIKNYDHNAENFIKMMELGDDSGEASVYHFFELQCRTYTDAVFFLCAFKNLKIWVNFELFTIAKPHAQPLLIRLNKGSNIIVIETPAAKVHDYYFLRVGAYKCESARGDLRNFFADTYLTIPVMRHLVCPNTLLSPGEPLVFSLFSNNTIQVDNRQDILCRLKDYYTGEILHERTVRFGEKCVIDTTDLSYDRAEEHNCLQLHLRFKDRTGVYHDCFEEVFLHPVETSGKALVARAEEMIAHPSEYGLDEYDRVAFRYHLEILEKYRGDRRKILLTLRRIENGLSLLEKGIHFREEIYSPTTHLVYFESKLDGHTTAYSIRAPRGYDPRKKYPLLVLFSTSELTDNNQLFKNDDIIIADISQRGFTMGSYVGEASLLEVFDEISKRFSIDEKHIWATGHSNGAFAAWSMAQAFPHIFAGILAVSGAMDRYLVQNLANTAVINVSSEAERGYRYNYVSVHPELSCMEKAIEVCAPAHTHNSLVYFMLNGQTIDKLCESTLEQYPAEINYTTRIHRHRRAFWLEMHGIQYGKVYARVHAKAEGNCIHMHLINATGITIEIPPQIDKKSFSVVINDTHRFDYKDLCAAKLHFISRGEEIIETAEQPPVTKLRKGNGLLDIYLGSMEIIPAVLCEEAKACAAFFSEPKSNGGNARIFIMYPILSPDALKDRDHHHDRAIIDCWHDCPDAALQQIRSAAPVQPDKGGYSYKGTYYPGDYCIMQIFPDPLCEEKNILYVCAGKPEMLSQNILTRKVVLPAYASGYHPYWNNDALIFDGKKYYRIFEYGMDIETV